MTPYCIVLTTCFYKKCAVEDKAPVKVNPFSVFLLSDWSGLLCTDQSISGRTSSRLYVLDMLLQTLLSDKAFILGGMQMSYTLQSN